MRAGPAPLLDCHVHCDGRSADELELMALTGVTRAVVPCGASNEARHDGRAFGARFDRLLGFERQRAARYGVRLDVALAVHAADVADQTAAREGIAEVARRLSRDGVVAIGELSLRAFSVAELDAFSGQLALAAQSDAPVLVEAPIELGDVERLLGLLDKALAAEGVARSRVCLLDLDGEKLKLARDLGLGGYGLPVGPRADGLFALRRKLDAAEVGEILADSGSDRLMLNTGAHFGSADPLGLAKTVLRLRLDGIDDHTINEVAYANADRFLSPATG